MSAKCAEISPVVRPLAYNDNTTSFTSPRRRCRLLTICGVNVPSRSRGTSISISPTASEITVFGRVPFRTFVAVRSGSASCFACPRCSVISAFNAASSTFLVNSFNKPSGPVRDKPFSLAASTMATAAACSGDSSRPELLIFVSVLTSPDVITHSAHPAGPRPACRAKKHLSSDSPSRWAGSSRWRLAVAEVAVVRRGCHRCLGSRAGVGER